jgi:rare lipoprotein A
MMNHIKKHLPLLIVAVLLTSCTSNFAALENNNKTTTTSAGVITGNGQNAAVDNCTVKNKAGERLIAKHEARSKNGNPKDYVVLGKKYNVMLDVECYSEEGIASWYGPNFNLNRSSSGEIFDMDKVSAAHKTLPLPSWVLVTNLDNGKEMVVRVNDRGPYHTGRIIDLSKAAAKILGIDITGTAKVRVELIPMGNNANAQYFIQAGAYGNKTNADRQGKKLADLIGSSYTLKQDGALYKVWLGPMKHTQAQNQVAKISREINNKAFVVEQ